MGKIGAAEKSDASRARYTFYLQFKCLIFEPFQVLLHEPLYALSVLLRVVLSARPNKLPVDSCYQSKTFTWGFGLNSKQIVSSPPTANWISTGYYWDSAMLEEYVNTCVCVCKTSSLSFSFSSKGI